MALSSSEDFFWTSDYFVIFFSPWRSLENCYFVPLVIPSTIISSCLISHLLSPKITTILNFCMHVCIYIYINTYTHAYVYVCVFFPVQRFFIAKPRVLSLFLLISDANKIKLVCYWDQETELQIVIVPPWQDKQVLKPLKYNMLKLINKLIYSFTKP